VRGLGKLKADDFDIGVELFLIFAAEGAVTLLVIGDQEIIDIIEIIDDVSTEIDGGKFGISWVEVRQK